MLKCINIIDQEIKGQVHRPGTWCQVTIDHICEAEYLDTQNNAKSRRTDTSHLVTINKYFDSDEQAQDFIDNDRMFAAILHQVRKYTELYQVYAQS